MHQQLYDKYPEYSGEDLPVVLNESQIDHLKDHLIGLLDQIYGKKPLHLDDFEWSLDEIAHTLDMKLPEGRPNLERKIQNDYWNFAIDLIAK